MVPIICEVYFNVYNLKTSSHTCYTKAYVRKEDNIDNINCHKRDQYFIKLYRKEQNTRWRWAFLWDATEMTVQTPKVMHLGAVRWFILKHLLHLYNKMNHIWYEHSLTMVHLYFTVAIKCGVRTGLPIKIKLVSANDTNTLWKSSSACGMTFAGLLVCFFVITTDKNKSFHDAFTCFCKTRILTTMAGNRGYCLWLSVCALHLVL